MQEDPAHQLRIEGAQAKGAVIIPASALGPRGKDGRHGVRVPGADGQPAPRQVRVGINNNVSAEITEGLAEGDKVVLGEAAAGAPSQSGMPRPPMRL